MQRAEAMRRNRRALYGTVAVLGAAEVAVTLMAPALGGVLLGATGAAGLLVRRGEQFSAQEHANELDRSLDSRADQGLTDGQTGLPNRQHLIEQVSREIARAERYSQDLTVAIVEVARLRELHHTWGEGTVEKAVRHVAETLRRVVRTSDFLARLDAHRFAVVLLGCDRQQAQLFGDRLSLAVSNRPLQGRDNGRLPVYVGVELTALQYEAGRFRGPMDFISAAGGEVEHFEPGATAPRAAAGQRQPAALGPAPAPVSAGRRTADAQSLRRRLVRDYYPEGASEEFAVAWGKFRSKAG